MIQLDWTDNKIRARDDVRPWMKENDMTDRNEEEHVVELVEKVFDELDRHAVTHQSAEILRVDDSLTDSGQHPRLSSIEREKMLRQLSVE